jgi:hypothetical protein
VAAGASLSVMEGTTDGVMVVVVGASLGASVGATIGTLEGSV